MANTSASSTPDDWLQISRRKLEALQQQATLLEREKKFRNLIENLNDIIYASDAEGNLVYISPSVEAILGYHPDELTGRSIFEFIYSEDLPRIKNRFEQIKTGIIEVMEYRLVTKSGNIHWFRSSSQPVAISNDNIGIQGIISDITQHKHAEIALKESESLYRTLFSDSSTIMLLIDPQTAAIVDANAAAISFYGYPREKLLALGIADINAMSLDEIKAKMQQTVTNQQRRFHFQHRIADGAVRDVMVHSSPVVIAGKQLLYSIITDETRHKRAVEELRQSEKLYRSLFENMLNGFAHCRMLFENGVPHDFIYLNVNRAFERLTGLKNVVGEKVSDIIPGIQKTDHNLIKIYGRVASTGIPERFEFYLKALNAWFDVSVYSPQPGDFIAIFDAISKRKQIENALRYSEQFARATLDSLSSHICILDENGVIIATNTAWREFGKANHSRTAVGFEGVNYLKICETAQGPESENAKAVAEGIRAIMKGEKDFFEFEYPCDSSEIRRWFVGRATRFQRGDIASVIISHEEITERKMAEQERLDLAYKLQQARKAESLGCMAGAIAHQFNNLLGVIMGNLELAMNVADVNAALLKRLNAAMTASQRAAEVSTLMLAYLGQKPGHAKPLNLVAFCRENLPSLKSNIPSTVTLQTRFSDDRPVILADAAQMRQILTHLVTNAWEAIGDKIGVVQISTGIVHSKDMSDIQAVPLGWKPANGDYAFLDVSDTGDGMSADVRERIFDPFFSTRFIGRGLGLAVVEGIVRSHNGAIVVMNAPEHGSTFRILFPLLRCEFHEELSPPPAPSDMPAKNTRAILIVEDEPMLQDITQTMLISFGYTVFMATDGLEAIDIFQQHKDAVACVLLDMTLPRMNGWETLTELRKLSPQIPVILTSGYAVEQVMAGEHPEQPQAFLQKPYQIMDLKATLAKCCL
jgi:PAS domain S-box-containing protein